MFRLFAAICLLSACAAPPAETPDVSPEIGAQTWKFENHAGDLTSISCPRPADRITPQTIEIKAAPVTLGGKLDGFTYVGGWHLTSDEPNFGGLSGLDLMPNGNLLTVSDTGQFFEIGLQDGAPSGAGAMAQMRTTEGKVLEGKVPADAEGLAYEQGLALVSFERDHRILAFAYEACGAGARGIEIAKLPGEQAGKMLDPNKGAEALSLNSAGELTFGYETGPGNGAPLGAVYGDGRARFVSDAMSPRGFAQVGRDEAGTVLAELFRSYDPVRGNRNVIRIGEHSASMVRPMTVDNFEGIALEERGDGKLRIWIISDDNFNPNQRTLLMAFEREE